MRMQIIVRVFALFTAGMGAAFLLGWHLGFSSILQLPPSTWPVPYVSSLCLLFSGLALLFLQSSSRVYLSLFLGGTIFFLGLQRVLRLLLPDSFGFLNSVSLCPSRSPQIPPFAATGFILVGIVFLLWRKESKNLVSTIIHLLFSSSIIFMASIGLFVNTVPAYNHELRRIFIHFYTALGLLFIGLAFLLTKFLSRSIKRQI